MAQVISDRYPYLRLFYQVRNYGNQVWAMVDTGFDGWLSLPVTLEAMLGRPNYAESVELADGSIVNTPAYYGYLQVSGFPLFPGIIILMGDEPVVGRGIIDHFKVTFDHGQKLIVEP